ncbi:MAG: PEP-CTERM sorting domain-containing protein [Pirellula sp.]|jgi:hypothetical protein|nr:PEP-CTERM sorting domain-containing protein [Pirellula sp.]
MKSFIFALIAVVASSFASVQAGYLAAGSAAFNASSGSLSGGTNTDAAFTFNTNAATSGSGSFSGNVGTTWGSFSVPVFGTTVGYAINISGDFGSFTGVSTNDGFQLNSQTNNVRSILATGFFTRSGFDPTPAFLSFSAGESGGSYSYLFNISVEPPAAVPEPASMAIFSLGAIGFAARRFRRK